MAKNLYIHTIDKDGNYKKETWKDVKITRDKGQIVKKRSADYNLSMGVYRGKEMLDIINPQRRGYPKSELSYVEFISFEKEILNQDDVENMTKFFLDDITSEVEELENIKSLLINKMLKFANLKIDKE